MNLQALLEETKESPPCGPDLEYDPAFQALEAAAQGKPEREIAGKLIAAVEPDWAQVRDLALGLLERSKDLRPAMHLVRALARAEHLAGFVAGLTLVNGLLQRFWPDLHPRLDADDHNDPTLRLNALASIEAPKGATGTETLLRDLREAFIVPPSPAGRASLRDLLILDGKLTPLGETRPAGAVEGAVRAAIAKDPGLADLPAAAIAAVRRLRELVENHVGGELAPDIGAAVDLLMPAVQLMTRLTGRDVAVAGETVGGQPRTAVTGEIGSREDVIRAIDGICAYLERAEPGHPAPLLLRRAQRLLNKSFVELIEDLAPDGVPQIKLIAGLKNE